MTEGRRDVTALLINFQRGTPEALDELIPFVYAELRSLASSYLRSERDGHTLQPTALVHEAFLKLVDQRTATWENRAHFFGVAAKLMRRIIVDHARRRNAQKRGGGQLVTLDTDVDISDERIDVMRVDDALAELEHLDKRQARVVELRFFAGLSMEEAAEVLGVSPATVKRDWMLAKAFLHRELSVGDS
ncbi:MAG: sigma-70 family RNA polymerase sigma factor [Gemmatimonadaceae bacterium]|nr:sigma-70 family RNA polymerase sigma factor [Gemmatimonadaceae bacterium]